HITPAVVLVKRPDAVQALLPGADTYLARDVHLSDPDAHRLHELVDWSPEDGVLTFYSGKAGTIGVGALTFVRVDTPHGPSEVAVGFAPQAAARGVTVTASTCHATGRVAGGGAWAAAGTTAGSRWAGRAAVRARTPSASRCSRATRRRATSSRRPFRSLCATRSATSTPASRRPSRSRSPSIRWAGPCP